MTKVLFISNDPLMFDAGSAVRSRMRAYKGLFDELHVISRSPLHVSGIVRDGNLILYPLPYGRMMARIMMVSRARAILRHVRGITVVSAQDPFEFGLIGFLARLGASAKLHIQIHTDIYSPHFMFHPPLNILRLLVASFVIRRADGIRVITERLREKIIQKYNSRAHISVLPIFTDIQTFAHMARLKHPRFKIALLTVSRLESEKNIALAIHALRMAREGGHDAGLTIVGDGRERENLLALARSCGLERYVDCVGWKDDVRPYLRAADILLFPSHYDGYGVAIIEALASGVPVLATDVGVAREAGAIVVSPHDFPRALVAWIEKGPRRGELRSYPYKNFDEYLRLFKQDIEYCADSTSPVQ